MLRFLDVFSVSSFRCFFGCLDVTPNTSEGFVQCLPHFGLHGLHGLHGPEEMHPLILREKVYNNIELGHAFSTFRI